MTATEKFLFDLDFDEIDSPFLAEIINDSLEDEVETEPVAPTFSEAEMEAAKQEAFMAGRQAGYAESMEGTESRILEIIGTVDEKMNTMFRAQAENNDDAANGALEVVLAMARKMFPVLNEREGLEEIETLAKQLLSGLISEPRVTVRTHESLVEDLEIRLRNYMSDRGFSGDMIILADPAMAPGHCRLEWSNGVARRDTTQMMAEIDAIVAANRLDLPPSEVGKQAELEPVFPDPEPAEPEQSLDAGTSESIDETGNIDQVELAPEVIPSVPDNAEEMPTVEEDPPSDGPIDSVAPELSDAREMLIDRDPPEVEHNTEPTSEGLDPDIFGSEPLDGDFSFDLGPAEDAPVEPNENDEDGNGQDEPADPNSV